MPNWESRPFEACIEKVTYTTKVQRKDFLDQGRFPVISQEEDFVNGYWDKPQDAFKVTSPVVLFGDHTKVLKYVDFDFVLGADGVKILKPKAFLLPKFLYYQLQAVELKSLGYARHYRLLKQLEICFPSISEQRRIVGILDEAFAGIATAKANAEKNIQKARAIFESYLASVFAKRGEGWAEKRLDEACEIIMGQSPDGESYNSTGEGVPLINGPVEFSPDPFGSTVRAKFTTHPTKLCKKDDLILCVRGSTTGRMNIAGFDACVGRGVAAIRANEYQPWINHFINAKREDIYSLGTGATFPNVSGAILGGLKLSVPDLPTQREIVSNFDSLRAETERLARLYGRKLAALEELKKSLLHQAFSGKL